MSRPPALLFIPDISGFTEFVTNTEIEHSRHIIAELLELLIDANEIGLTLAEIEGDALFFYKDDELPSREALFRQIENMFLKFHDHLLAYKYRRVCRCGACTTATDLKLKFVAHAGAMELITVKDSSKPFGPNVVLAHRLLKNSVNADEYALLSFDLHEQLTTDATIQVKLKGDAGEGTEDYDVGQVEYCYFPLQSLMEYVRASDSVEPGSKVEKPWVLEMNVEAPVEELYDLISNFDRRLEWNKGIADLNYEENRVNRVGSEHQCVVDDKLINFETIVADFGGKWVYGERTTDVPLVDEVNTYFILEPEDEQHTKLTIEVHPVSRSLLKSVAVPLLKMLAWKKLQEPFAELKKLAEKREA